jgi:hypothetical protein
VFQKRAGERFLKIVELEEMTSQRLLQIDLIQYNRWRKMAQNISRI